LPLEVTTTGKVEAIPLKEFVQHAPLSGRITDVKVDLGDNVKAGEVMVTVDSPEINQLATETLQDKADLENEIIKEKAQLDAEVEQSRVQLTLWENAYKRDSRLLEEGIVSQKAMLESQTQLKLAQSKLQAAIEKRDISLKALKTKLKVSFDSLTHRLSQLGVSDQEVTRLIKSEHTILTVPVRSARSGVVTDITAFAGEGIDPKVPLFKISDLTQVWITADVYEDDMARMKVGEYATARVAALPNEIFKGRLAYIGRQVSPDTRTLPVRVEVQNPEIKLKPGMFANVHIQTSEPTPAIIVPKEAVVENAGHHMVFLELRGGYQPCRVKIGRSLGDDVEIIEGLQPGQAIVVRGAFQLEAELLKTHGGANLFLQVTEGERSSVDDEKPDTAKETNALTYQVLAVAVLAAFLLGFGISLFVPRLTASAEHKRSAQPDSEKIRRG
jgi:cobalt-zinc-cadmium efflux system membrane fusion protein